MAPLEELPEALTNLDSRALAEVLEAHGRYLARRPGGQRALLGFHDLSERDFGGCNLSEGDFSGALLHRARFPAAILRADLLFSADFPMAGLKGADLSRPDLRAACLRGAPLDKAILSPGD